MNKKPGSIKIFIGHDSRYPEATKVCKASILKYWPEANITYLDKSKLKEIGVYGREDIEGESTEFSFTRFYVPMYLRNSSLRVTLGNPPPLFELGQSCRLFAID